MNLNRIAKILVLVIAVIGFILFLRIFSQDEETIKNDATIQASLVDPLITFSMVLLGITVAITLVLSLFGLFKNPSALKKALMGITILGSLLVIAYFMADNSQDVLDVAGKVLKDGGAKGSSVSKWVSTGIWYSLFLGIIGGGLFVFDLLKGIVKS